MDTEDREFEDSIARVKDEVEGRTGKSVVVPEWLSEKSRFSFRCHPGIACFTACCSGIKIYLSPYDIFRLKTRLGMTYQDFLSQYAVPAFIEKSSLPIVVLKMNDDEKKSCPFVTPEGCTVYTDRPMTCRYYPLGMGFMKKYDKTTGEGFFVKIREDHCLGHQEDREWTVAEWTADQGADVYDEMNHDWMEIILKAKTLGQVEFSRRSLDLFYMVSSNLDMFRSFVFNSKFLDSYELDPETIAKLKNDDLELLKFSLKWLRYTLYGEGDFKVREEARKEAEERIRAARQEEMKQQDAKDR